jgi:holin-like protein
MIKSLAGVFALLLFAAALDGLVTAFALPLPAPVVAMALLLLFLNWNGHVPDYLDLGIAFLFRLFPLFFIPPLVALVPLRDLIAAHWFVLLFTVTVSTALGLMVTALLYKALRRGGAA